MTGRVALLVGGAGALVLALSVALLVHQGFSGISHDDAARTLLAVDFARAPTLDPTRSSWLPVPTYLLGAALRAAPSVSIVPRALSLFSGFVTCVLAALVARAAGARAAGATLAVTGASAWRWTVLTAAAPGVAEMPAVALLLAATLVLAAPVGRGARVSTVGALTAGALLALACGCRYEAWFAAPALLLAYAVVARDRRGAVLAGAVALVAPAAWVAINAARHGDPLEFVHRVEAFRRSEGLPAWTARVALYPGLVVTETGALTALAVAGMARAPSRAVSSLAAAPALAVLTALVWTEARGGGATHHPARALLPVVWCLVPLAACGFDALWNRRGRSRAFALAAVLALFATVAWGNPRAVSTVDPDAVATGRAVKAALETRPDTSWLIELSREDFLWVELASEAPGRSVPDRAYHGTPPTESALRTRLAGVAVAAVCTEWSAGVVRGMGYTLTAHHGPWRVYAR